MNYWDLKLMREQLNEKLSKFRGLNEVSPPSGWIRIIREALGMSTKQLAKRANLDQSRISRIEIAEQSGELKLSTLNKVAEALNMQLVYAFVPKSDLENMVRDQARKRAIQKLKKLNHTMRLEQQELSDIEKEKALNNMIEKILMEEQKKIWD